MVTAQMTEFLRRLKAGKADSSDMKMLDGMSAGDFRAEIATTYAVPFQARRLKDKWEFAAARSLRFELRQCSAKHAAFPMLIVTPVFRRCVFLSGEADRITAVSIVSRLVVRPIDNGTHSLALTTGRGFKLD